MVKLSEPAHLTDVAIDMGIQRGEWGDGKSSVILPVESRHCNKGGVAHGGIYSMMLDMALGGALVSVLPVEEWCATTQLNISFITAAHPDETYRERWERNRSVGQWGERTRSSRRGFGRAAAVLLRGSHRIKAWGR